MNNIEILEDLEKYISFANKQSNFSNDADYKWHKELAGMIENLIKENKELKKLEDVTIETLKDTNYIHNNYIPKSKVTEKIEELERQKQNVIHEVDFKAFYRITDLKNVEINILKELLKGE